MILVFKISFLLSISHLPKIDNKKINLAGVVGVEPTSGVLETLILPMNYTPFKIYFYIIQ